MRSSIFIATVLLTFAAQAKAEKVNHSQDVLGRSGALLDASGELRQRVSQFKA